ncbi:uncharacterized protein LOC144040138 [Vanacampus margaritifer]
MNGCGLIVIKMENGEDLTWRKESSTKMTKDNPNSRNTVHLRSRSVHPVRCACIGKEILGIISHLQGRFWFNNATKGNHLMISAHTSWSHLTEPHHAVSSVYLTSCPRREAAA